MAKVKRQGHLNRLAESIEVFSKKRVAVGFFDTAVYTNGTPVASVAAAHEFGNGIVPPRPFMRTTINEQQDAWRKTLSASAGHVLADKLSAEQMFDAFGQLVAGQIKEKIESITAPALASSTIAARLRRNNTSTKPLDDTGYMLSSVNSQVQTK